MRLSWLAGAHLPERARSIMRDFFYLHLPLRRTIFHFISSCLPPFVPIEGYLIEGMPRNGDTVVDAGSYPGNFTIVLSRLVGRQGTVLAFEANRKNFRDLSRRIRKLRLKNVIALNVALWDTDNERFCTTMDGEGSSLFGSGSAPGAAADVDTKTLDTILSELGISRVDYVKMDIEGAEIEAINGAARTLSAYSPDVAIASYHERDGVPTCKAVSELLQRSGYRVKTGFPGHLTVYGVKDKNPG